MSAGRIVPTYSDDSRASATPVPYPAATTAAAQPQAANPGSTAAVPAALYPRNGEYVVLWQSWHDDWWVDYDPAFCTMLEEAAQGNVRSFQHCPGGNVTYEYNLVEMWQQNLTTSTRRSMRRLFWWGNDEAVFQNRHTAVKEHNARQADPTRGRHTASSSSTRSGWEGASRGGGGRQAA